MGWGMERRGLLETGPHALSPKWQVRMGGWEVGTGRTYRRLLGSLQRRGPVFSLPRKWQVLKHSAWWEQKQYFQVARSSQVPMGSLKEEVGLAYSRASQGIRERRYSSHHRGTRKPWMTVTFSEWDESLWESLCRKVTHQDRWCQRSIWQLQWK